MPCCTVSGCSYHSRHSTLFGISFHRFPQNSAVRKQWLHACKRADIFCIDTVVCSFLFDEDFERDLKAEMLDSEPRRILKEISVPHLNMPNLATSNE